MCYGLSTGQVQIRKAWRQGGGKGQTGCSLAVNILRVTIAVLRVCWGLHARAFGWRLTE